MECNKEDANKAKEVAEKKMEAKDFEGAKSFALKAQRLNPNIESISQIITICDVHIAAANNILDTNCKDWYRILQIDPTAEEASIKKQFRKFALVLHPDKNSFAGAADAFKIIGEAQRVLLDQVKRTVYDTKRNAAVAAAPAAAAAAAAAVAAAAAAAAATSVPSDDKQTFWTVCPSCRVKYKFYIETLNRRIKCQNCKKLFACKKIKSPKLKSKSVGDQGRKDSPLKTQSNVFGEKNATAGPTNEPKSDSKKKGSSNNMGFEGESENSGRFNSTKRKLDTINVSPSKKVKDKESSGNLNPNASKESDTKGTVEPKIKLDLDTEMPKEDNEADICDYPDPDFSDFDKDRQADKFAVGQIWAAYDTFDAMPRLYTRIREVISPGLKMDITWVEPDPDNMDEIKWASEGLPVSCGKFKYGEPDITEDYQMFSHFICWDKGRRRDNLNVYPRKGETWAVFKDWNIKWYANRDRNKKKFKYEFVEILSEYDDVAGVSVAYLLKIKDFTCLFCRKDSGRVLISPKEMFRFSHRVPSVKMTGKEREDVPEGSFELDPASLPIDLFRISVPKYVNLTEAPATSLHESPDSLTRSKKEDVSKSQAESPLSMKKDEDILKSPVDPPKSVKKDEGISKSPDDSHKSMKKDEGISKSPIDSPESMKKDEGISKSPVDSLESMKKDEGISKSPVDSPESMIKDEGISKSPVDSTKSLKKDEDITKSPVDSPKSVKKGEGILESPVDPPKSLTRSKDKEFCKPSADFPETVTRPENAGPLNSAEPSTKSKDEDVYEIPDAEFYNFDADKAPEKIFPGDIWALYSDEDGLPKYYGLIKNVKYLPELRIELKWLVSCVPPKNIIKFRDKEMPVSCGKFKPQKSKVVEKYTCVDSFSHRVRASTTTKDIYIILPKKGEVWALYKNWSAEMKCEDLENCEYDIVEVIEENDALISVSMLEVVKDHKSVYKPQVKEGLIAKKDIPRAELYRFSHQLPAFKLTEDAGGSFKGLWELDTAALPVLLLCSSS